jgi:hypothetical protein
VVGRLRDEDLQLSELFVRHQGRDYSRIWSGEPFSDYVPLMAQASPSYSAQVGQPLVLDVTATGGRGDYKFQWTPEEGLANPNTAQPQVDTSKPGNKRYTITVTDGSGKTAQAQVMVSIREPIKPVEQAVVQREPDPIPVPKQITWPDGQYKELRMALLRRSGDRRLDEFMLCDTRNQANEFYKVGDPFDGGELIFVHQTGGVVHRKNNYFVYPLGSNLAQAIPAAEAVDYPELQKAAEYHREAVLRAARPADKPEGSSALPTGQPNPAKAEMTATGPLVETGEALSGPPIDSAQPPAVELDSPDGQAPAGELQKGSAPKRSRIQRKPR